MYHDRRQVLVTDDDPAIRRLLSKILSTAGYEVCEAVDGQHALEMVRENVPDFLITDWEMPRMTGPELCDQIRQLTGTGYIYVVLLTSKSMSDDIIRGLDSGADDFVTKPVVPGELLARMQAGARVLQVERQLQQAAKSDPLTGILNRRQFHDDLEREWSRAVRHRHDLSCVVLDLDYFKSVNDTHGHPIGDHTIKVVADVLQRHTRSNDYLCRYGGEEFCALLTETSEREALYWCERVRSAIQSTKIAAGAKDIRVTVSLGVAQRDSRLQGPEELVDRADQALLVAKHSGRNRVVRFSSLEDSGIVSVDGDGAHFNPFRSVLARDIMTTPVRCLNQDDTITQAADFLLNLRINSAPVVDEQGFLTGIASEKDLMDRMTSPSSWQQPILTAMSPNVVTYDEDTPAGVVFSFLQRVAVRRVVIVKDGKPTGVISRGNIIHWFKDRVAQRPEADAAQLELPRDLAFIS